jgi:cytochrome c-type biogenesis protein CcmH
VRALAGALFLLLAVGPAGAAVPTDTEVEAVARELRCVVCQSLSVADSPSEMARQMRDLVRERLAAGESPEAVKRYFVSRYGEWVLLTPPTRGFGLLAWTLPLAVLGAGVVGTIIVLRRWSRRGAALGDEAEASVDEADLEALREEMRRTGR